MAIHELATLIDSDKLRSKLLERIQKERPEESLPEWERILGSGNEHWLESSRTGASIYINREAQADEYCLDVEEYADILAKFIRDAEPGEFCFALFGHWGRGKTFMMNRVVERLVPNKHTSKPPAGLEAAAPSLKYEDVRFSAWRYPNRPEVWVHLYQTFSEVAFGSKVCWLTRLRRTFHIGMQKNGSWPLILGVLGLAIACVPKLESIGWLTEIFGIAGVAFLLIFMFRASQVTESLSRQYLNRPNHSGKLGLQATIGQDLEQLIKSWLCSVDLPGYPRFPMAVAMTALWAGFGWRMLDLYTDPFTQVCMAAVVPGLFWLAAIFGLPELLRPAEKDAPDRLLLVVDDLDRCDWEQLLVVIESIKVFLEHEQIRRRVQVVMLLEEGVLHRALLQKYNYLTQSEDSSPDMFKERFTERRIFRENNEKLFTAYLRLPELDNEEFKEVINTFVRARLDYQKGILQTAIKLPSNPEPTKSVRKTEDTEPGEDASREEAVLNTAQHKLESMDESLEIVKPPARGRVSVVELNPDFIFDKAEIKAIHAKVNGLSTTTQHCQYWGPRSIRSFLFRYQLAREILKKLGHPVDPEVLLDRLTALTADQHFSREETHQDPVKKVAAQVA